jgi:hypothetical protein
MTRRGSALRMWSTTRGGGTRSDPPEANHRPALAVLTTLFFAWACSRR